MRLNSKKILGISVAINSKEEILEYIEKCLENKEKTDTKSLTIVTPNPEQIVLAGKNPHFAEFLNRADVAIPDGIGIVWADRFLHPKPHLMRIAGVELMEDLVRLAGERHVPVGLIGSRGGVAVKALECLQKKHSGLRGWAMDGPEIDIKSHQYYQSDEFDQLIKKIKETKTQIVFVGLGAPKQEYFIEKLRSKIYELRMKTPIVFMSVGGSFDEISGKLPMPPRFIDRYGLKWLWRLVLEPWRWKRQLALLEFIWLVVKEKLMF